MPLVQEVERKVDLKELEDELVKHAWELLAGGTCQPCGNRI